VKQTNLQCNHFERPRVIPGGEGAAGGRVIIFRMSLTIEEVEHIAALTRLKLTSEEKARYREQLSQILDYAQRLQGIDTSDIPPTSSVLPPRSILRHDQPRPSLPPTELLDRAASIEDQQYKVPPVLE
jgi:aspartyl-tRNA(Asn)/glutamyl-tRNA(Gln) amidotransferase subunit C